MAGKAEKLLNMHFLASVFCPPANKPPNKNQHGGGIRRFVIFGGYNDRRDPPPNPSRESILIPFQERPPFWRFKSLGKRLFVSVGVVYLLMDGIRSRIVTFKKCVEHITHIEDLPIRCSCVILMRQPD